MAFAIPKESCGCGGGFKSLVAAFNTRWLSTHTPNLIGDNCTVCGDALRCFHGLDCKCRFCPLVNFLN